MADELNNNYVEESETVKSLRVQLEIENAKSSHLAQENSLLRYKLIRQSNAQLQISNSNVKCKMKLFVAEGERDKMYENLEKLKGKYNKLHAAFLEKARRCNILEEVFARQKFLPGLVKKSLLMTTMTEEATDATQTVLQYPTIFSTTIPPDTRTTLTSANAKIIHLTEENAILRYKFICQTNEQLSTSSVNVESHMKLFAAEEERDKIYENFEKLKAKYNKLHTAFLEKLKRCKILEEVFHRQKTLPGLVKKSHLMEARNDTVIDNSRQQQLQDENIINSTKIAELQRSLDEAFDIIDELDFELESVDFLEMENERLKNELNKLKKKEAANKSTSETMATTNDDDANDDADGRRNEDHHDISSSSTCLTKRENCGSDDSLPDLESIERSVQTQSSNDTVQAESHLLRRELLRSRLQNTRPPQRTSGLYRHQPQSPTEKLNSSVEE